MQAVEVGVQGIVVSNHGGRQVDGNIASLDMLPDIAQAVGDKIDIRSFFSVLFSHLVQMMLIPVSLDWKQCSILEFDVAQTS